MVQIFDFCIEKPERYVSGFFTKMIASHNYLISPLTFNLSKI